MKDRSDRGRTNGHVPQEEVDVVFDLRFGSKLTHKLIALNLGIKTKRVEYILTKRSPSIPRLR